MYHNIPCQVIHARDLVVCISFRVFLTSDVMIGETSDESGLAFFSEECWYWSVELYSSVQKRADLQYFISVCLYLILIISHFTCIFLWSPLYICFGPPPL